MSAASRLYPLPFLAVAILAGCSSQSGQPVSKGEKPVDVASVVRQKMPASVKDREAWAKDIATTFKSQGLAPTVENSLFSAGCRPAGVRLSGGSCRAGTK